MALFPMYSDVVGFLEDASAAIETNSLVGGNATLSTAYPAGSTTIVVSAVTTAAQTYAVTAFLAGPAWILDGLNSEVVQVTSNAAGTLTLASPGTLITHSAGVSIASAGTAGNLAKALADASRRVETHCRQGPAGVTGISNAAVTTLVGSYSAGATSLTLSSGTNAQTGFARILDGASSELVYGTLSGATLTITAPGLAFAHATLTPILTGVAGDRNLYAQPRSETYTLGTMTNHVDSDGTLVLHPYHFPVISASTIVLQLGTYTGNAVSFTGLVYPNDGRMIMIPYVSWANTNAAFQWVPNVRLRDPNLWVQMTYTAGPIPLAVGSTPQLALVPDDIKRATYLYALSVLSSARANPLGLASSRQGDVQRQFELRGMTGGESNLNIKEANEVLAPYRR